MHQETQPFPRSTRAGVLVTLGLFCLAPVSGSAQPQDLAAADDGSVLYFSSALRLKGSAEYPNSKIFKYANGTYDLVDQVDPAVTLGLRFPNVSGDGRILAYDETASCVTGASCQPMGAHGIVSGAKLPSAMTASGSLRISHNGRFSLRFGGVTPSFVPTQLYDLQIGTLSNVLGNVPRDGRQSVADDGTVFTSQGLWHNGEFNALKPTHHGGALIHVWYYNEVLYEYNPANGAEVQLDQSPQLNLTVVGSPFFQPPPYFSLSVSNDGRTVLYRDSTANSAAPQAVLANADGTGRRVLTAENSGITETVLSGDGHRAYAVTGGGALLSINVDSGDIERLLPDAPLINQPGTAVVPGSFVILYGQSLTTAAGQSQVGIAGYSAPLLNSSSRSITLQVPWELDLSSPATFIAADPASPFEQATPIQPVAAAPQFLGVVHQDFRGAPTSSDPAHPGEIMAFYMTGLGPVSPQVATGLPAPLDILSNAQLPLSCQWNVFGNGPVGEVLFAGLAPGQIGVYQVNVRVAANLDYGQLSCSSLLPSGSQSKATLISFPVAVP